MTVIPLCLLVLLAPQGETKPGRLKLPPPAQASAPKAQGLGAGQLSELQRFHRDALKLRRTLHLSNATEELIIKRIAGDYEHPDKLALELARKADADLMRGLLKITLRFGDRKDGEELLFLLLTRPFASATRDAVTTMAEISGAAAKESLLSCLTARYAGVRKAASDLLLSRIGKSDLPRILALSNEKKDDIKRKALFLLGALPYRESRERLLSALSSPMPTLAATACQSLIAHGPDALTPLQAIVSRPALDYSFGYAAFALARLEEETGQELIPTEAVVYLSGELNGKDPFMQATSALALAEVALRSDDAKGFRYGDARIVDALLLVVAPKAYVPNMSMLFKRATTTLVMFTGQDFRGRGHAWRAWWEEARSGFVGMRQHISVTPENGAHALLSWKEKGRVLQFRGERSTGSNHVPGREEFVLGGSDMAALVQRLEKLGFMGKGIASAAAAAAMLPMARTLELRVGSRRTLLRGPAAPVRWLDGLAVELKNVAARERWQLYPDPKTEKDFMAFWHAERTWLTEHTDRRMRERRLEERILTALPAFAEKERGRALEHLFAIPQLGDLLTESDGLRLARLAAAQERVDGKSFPLIEAALLAPGEAVWRSVLEAVDSHFEQGGRQILSRVFSLLGSDKVLAAFQAGRKRLRVAAMLEIAKLKDLRAVDPLLATLGDKDRAVRETAVYTLGMLRVARARPRLLQLAAAADTDPRTRRVVWVALGRVGGNEVLPVLQAAAAFPDLNDQLAAIRAMGELRNPRAAALLAQIFAIQGLSPRGTQAMAALQQQGALLARPALRRFVSVRDQRVRREIIMLLAEFQDPGVVPDLIAQLPNHALGTRAALLLSGITGVDLTEVNDRVRFMRDWWKRHKDLPQAMWFLQALRQQKVKTGLVIEQLAPNAGVAAVPELTKIMLETRKPNLRVLAGALLRDITDREFGTISMQSTVAQVRAVADRYRFFADSEKGTRKR